MQFSKSSPLRDLHVKLARFATNELPDQMPHNPIGFRLVTDLHAASMRRRAIEN